MIDCPQFLLVCEARCGGPDQAGSWRFVLEQLDGQPYLEAFDSEPGDANRLALLAVVRGLEALPGPASVTMLSSSRYVIRSLSDSLPRWRDAGFVWEHFGQRLEVTNADLWRRVDRALDIHAVSACCVAAAPVAGRRIPRHAPRDRRPTMQFAAAPVPAARFAHAPYAESAYAESAYAESAYGGPRLAEASSAAHRPERWSEVTDGLRRWLVGQCQSVTGDYQASASGHLAVA